MENAKGYSENLINYMICRLAEVKFKLSGLDKGNPEYDSWYQIRKDLEGYIADQEWTIGLIEDGNL